MVITPNPAPSPSNLDTLLRRRTRTNHGTWTNTRYQDEVFYYSILDPSLSYQDEIIVYREAIKTDFQTVILNGTDPCAYADSHKNDPYNPSWNETMHGNEFEYYISATNKDISQLAKQKTWEKVTLMTSLQDPREYLAVLSRVPGY